jgi:hypothetical protein
MQTDTATPSPSSFTPAPLRNRMRVELHAPASEVWALIGNLERYPEYSAGLARVEVERDASGKCTGYVCHFRPQEEGGESVSHREIVRWMEPNRGYASMAAEPNASGLKACLTFVTLEPSSAGTVLTWSEYYESTDVPMQKAVFDEALADIAKRLVARFGGRIVERFVEGGAARAT